MLKHIVDFVKINKAPLAGMFVGLIVGYFFWYFIACYTGTFLLLSEWWVNCIFGMITGGFLVCLVREYVTEKHG
ncbi:MAG: hypothetical protein LUH15_19005 [Tannerellaceae bacterium]|nr:hypothetical protein [Tannerellaceae bacterium]